MLIGKKIKTLREAKGMSLTELSRESGVQLATLSRIENLKMTGTLESHANIAKALGVGLIELYRDISLEDKKIELKQEKREGDIFVHSDKSSFEILTGKLLSKKMMPVLLKIEPEGKTTIEQNSKGTEKFVFVIEGNVEVHIENDTYPLSRYNTLYFDASLKHCFVNKDKTTAKILCVTTPVAL